MIRSDEGVLDGNPWDAVPPAADRAARLDRAPLRRMRRLYPDLYERHAREHARWSRDFRHRPLRWMLAW